MKKKSLIKNTIASILQQLIYIISGLILPRILIENYGSEINGLVNSITQFLGYISLLELGLSSVVSSALYKPLAENDEDEISRIVISSEKFFKKIAQALVLYIVLLVIFYPFLNNQHSFLFTSSLIIIVAISVFWEYYLGLTWTILLNADQKSYIPSLIKVFVVLLNLICCIFLIIKGMSIHVVKLASALIFILKPFILNKYAQKNYKINRNVEIIENPIKQRKYGIAQHIAYTIFEKTDVAVLTLFSTLEMVSVYSVYRYVVDAVSGFIQMVMGNITAILGDLLAKNEREKLNIFFEIYCFATHIIATILFSATAALIIPFIKLYTRGITDADYIVPWFSVILIVAYAIHIIETPYTQMVLAAGHYKQTQNCYWLQMLINIFVSVFLVIQYGLTGVALGTLCAMCYKMLYLVWYISKNIILIKTTFFIRMCVTDLISVLLMYHESKYIIHDMDNYMVWFQYALEVTVIFALSVAAVNLLINFKWIVKKYHIFTIKYNKSNM